MLLFPSSWLCMDVLWDCVSYGCHIRNLWCLGRWYALSPLLLGYGISPPLCAMVRCLLIRWFWRCLVRCWLIGLHAGGCDKQAGWLFG